jgi:hypothetical protein
LESQQSNETPSIFFIQTRDDTIDRAMLFGYAAERMSLARLTTALMNTRFIRWFHDRHPLFSNNLALRLSIHQVCVFRQTIK